MKSVNKPLMVLCIVVILLFSGSVGFITGYSDVQTHNVENLVTSREQTQCFFDRVVATIPVTPQDKGKLGVELVSGARQAYEGNQCISKLPAPSAYLIKLEKQYNVSYRK